MSSSAPTFQGREYWARKGGVSLFVWRKQSASADPSRPPLVLVHGSSLSALPCFDLHVPGVPDYSFMDWLARHGYDVWTLDHEGYGRSTITDSNSDVACGVEDLKVAVDFIKRETGATKLNFYGLSSGALRAASYAEAEPQHVARLILDGFVWTGDGSPTLAKRREGVNEFRASNRRPISRASIESIFTRDHPGTSEPTVMKACAEAQLAYADSVPTGTYLDMTTRLPLVDPARIKAPTLVIRGKHDGIATEEDLAAFFVRLPSPDKQFTVLPDLAHVTPLGTNRRRLWEAVDGFLRAGA